MSASLLLPRRVAVRGPANASKSSFEPLLWRRSLATTTAADNAPFKRILVANRGEIACRVIRTCDALNIPAVAVCSTADASAQHVRMASAAYPIGPPPTSESYLNVDAIVKACLDSGADAVHPGYGFLSENFRFVKALRENDITFIGPSEQSMRYMGDKIQSKIIAKKAGVNTIPGFEGKVESATHAVSIAEEIGYPVMLKASAGGGGKGMRIAQSAQDVKELYNLTKNEAKSSFGDDSLLVEKFISRPRHIEIQIVGDKHGNYIALPERECSIQRRNQKVIEESPSTHMTPETRSAMARQAVQLAKEVGYYSAGTVEFLSDEHRNFYFLEMNTRLQVEHPISELISGLDLVELMIKVAAGHPLPASLLGKMQNGVLPHDGWAFESRVYAEDPLKFLPSIGTLQKYIEPETSQVKSSLGPSGDNVVVRKDSGVREGSVVSVYYDPMICKLSTWGETRDQALGAMTAALDTYCIEGVTHNISLLRDVYSEADFRTGNITTQYLEQKYPSGFRGRTLRGKEEANFITLAAVLHQLRREREWAFVGSRTVLPAEDEEFLVKVEGQEIAQQHEDCGERPFHVVRLAAVKGSTVPSYSVSLNGDPHKQVTVDWSLESPLFEATLKDESGERNEMLQYVNPTPLGYCLSFKGTKYNVQVLSPLQRSLITHMKAKPKIDTTRFLRSPMPGTVVSILVEPGQTIKEGQDLCVVEAMKMQNMLKSAKACKVKDVKVGQGSSVMADEVLMEFA